MLSTFLTIVFVLICLVLCVVILLQSSKGGGLGAGLGGGGSAATQVFGGQGPGGFLARTTVILAALYMVLSLVLANISSGPQSVIEDDEDEVSQVAEEEAIEDEGTLPIPEAILNRDAQTDGVTPGQDVRAEDGPAAIAPGPPTNPVVDPPPTFNQPVVPSPPTPAPLEEPAEEPAPAAPAAPVPAAPAAPSEAPAAPAPAAAPTEPAPAPPAAEDPQAPEPEAPAATP